MNFKVITSLLLLSVSASAHSTYVMNQEAVYSTTGVKIQKCPSFDGKWKGTCAITNLATGVTTKSDDETEISAKNCDFMTIKGVDYVVDGIRSETLSRKAGTRATTIIMQWNDEVKPEFIKYSYTIKSFKFLTNVAFEGFGSGTFKLENNIFKVEQVSEQDKLSCEYLKN